MNEVSKERGHTYWKPFWMGGLVGIVAGGMLAFVLYWPMCAIIAAFGDSHYLSDRQESIALALSCLWGSGCSTYWFAHQQGREFAADQVLTRWDARDAERLSEYREGLAGAGGGGASAQTQQEGPGR
jgi:hypothetical protein